MLLDTETTGKGEDFENYLNKLNEEKEEVLSTSTKSKVGKETTEKVIYVNYDLFGYLSIVKIKGLLKASYSELSL